MNRAERAAFRTYARKLLPQNSAARPCQVWRPAFETGTRGIEGEYRLLGAGTMLVQHVSSQFEPRGKSVDSNPHPRAIIEALRCGAFHVRLGDIVITESDASTGAAAQVYEVFGALRTKLLMPYLPAHLIRHHPNASVTPVTPASTRPRARPAKVRRIMIEHEGAAQ